MNIARGHGERKPPFQFITRFIPLAVIVVLVMLLLPQLYRRPPQEKKLPQVEPPLAMNVFKTGFAGIDTLLNTGMRQFGRGDYNEATRLLGKAHFYLTVKIKEGEASRYPDDLRFYLGLAHFYRGYPHLGIPLLEAEEEQAPNEEKYPWYLAHLYLAEGNDDKARNTLEKVARLNGTRSQQAAEMLSQLPE